MATDMVLWGRPNCLLDLPMGCPDLRMGRTMELGTSPWSEDILRVVFLGVTIYPKEVVRRGCLKCISHQTHCIVDNILQVAKACSVGFPTGLYTSC